MREDEGAYGRRGAREAQKRGRARRTAPAILPNWGHQSAIWPLQSPSATAFARSEALSLRRISFQ